MAIENPPIVQHSGSPVTFTFRLGPKPQQVWGLSHATWFYAMGVGSALFLNSLLFGIEFGTFLGMSLAHLLGIFLVAVGGLILMADLGRPERFWRALMNPKNSWISVGAICDFIFLLLDTLYVLPDLVVGGNRPFAALAWSGTWWSMPLLAVAAICAFIIIVYPGLVLSYSPSIPFWNTTLIPLQYLAYSFASALGLAMAIGVVSNSGVSRIWVAGEAVLLFCCSLLLAAHLINAYQLRGTAKESARRLVKGGLAKSFWVGVCLAGLVIPLLLLAVASTLGEGPVVLLSLVGVGVLTQVGNFLSKLYVLRVGLYPPIF